MKEQEDQILERLDEQRALALEKKLNSQKAEEQKYIEWLKKIKPNWSEKQILQSAGKKFNKNFLKVEIPDENETLDEDEIEFEEGELIQVDGTDAVILDVYKKTLRVKFVDGLENSGIKKDSVKKIEKDQL